MTIKIFSELLESTMRAVSADINKENTSGNYKKALENYLSILKPSLGRYEHHQGNKITDRELQERFESETALLHVITELFLRNVNHKLVIWPINEVDSPYKWYKIPCDLSVTIDEVAIELFKLDSPTLIISQISGQVLDRVCKRYLGEFYTPLSIAKHLIESSGLHPREVLNGKRIIDPACGGGIILTAIADKVILYSREKNYSTRDVLQILSQNFFGFDIQPFAVCLTKTLLIHYCLPLLTELNDEIPDLFPNIRLQDTLTTYDQYWIKQDGSFQSLSGEKGFHYIIGNPPFMSAKGQHLDYSQHYTDVLYGHPNLYQLFLWWAVRSARQRGIISFLLPQSMLTGIYFKKLREQLNLKTNIISLTRMIDRTGVIGEADLQMMVVCLEVSEDKSLRENDIKIRVVRNGTDISLSKPYSVKYNNVVHKIKESPVIWIVSNDMLDYRICEMLEVKSVILNDLSNYFTSGNGGYVWNQHKELLREQEEKNSLPLISATSIDLYGFTFPYVGPHASRSRLFSTVTDNVRRKVHTQPAILIQRTTPRKVGRRLVSGIFSNQFHQQYPRYFLENHVNYIKEASNTKSEILYGLLGWLNSDLINFIFQLRNGTTLVSVSELGLLPVNLEMVKQLIIPTQNIINSTGKARTKNIKIKNDLIFDWLEFDFKYRQRISDVLNRKEKGHSHDKQFSN
ncbi:N-6 DNA methylase [Anaerolineales bacterium HSG6]|nr:N-6 DNA methylase [Anaerolineales bacterium HSG6]